MGDRTITLVREITKIHETVLRTSLGKTNDIFINSEPKGEYVILIEGKSYRDIEVKKQSLWEEKTILEHMDIYLRQGQDKKEAMKLVAKDRGISKRDVYQELIDLKERE